MKYLVDTNVLIYPFQRGSGAKAEKATAVLRRLAAVTGAALPAQVLAEFANVALRKIGMPGDLVAARIAELSVAFPVLPLSEAVILEAVRGVESHRLSYFDSQIWAVARLHAVPVIISEDFAPGSDVGGVGFLNPFLDGFDPASLT